MIDSSHLPTLAAVLVLSLTPSHAEIIGVETFDDSDGPIAGNSGGLFWDYSNNTVSPVHTGTSSAWSALTGAPTSASGKLVTNDSSARRAYNGASEYDGAVNDPLSAPSSDANIVYHRVTFSTGATVPDEILLTSFDFGTARIQFGKSSGSTNLGLELLDPFAVASVSGTTVQSNSTYMLVTKIDYVNNLAELWVNPDLSEPEGTPDVSETYSGSNWSTAISLSSSSGDSVSWDNLVVATSWDDLGSVVTHTDDSGAGSLRDAIANAPDGGLITFDPSLDGSTITLTSGELSASKNGAIDASSLTNGIRISGNHVSRVMSVASGKHVRLNHLTIADGFTNSYGGGIISTGQLFMVDCNITGNTAVEDSGGIDSAFGSSIDALRCTFSENSGASGGAIRHQNAGSVTLRHCTFSGNRATGGAGGGGLVTIGGTLSLNHCTITENQAPLQAGGLFVQSPAIVSLENCIIAGNQAPFAADIIKVSGTLTPSGTNLIGSNKSVESEFPSDGILVGTSIAPVDPKLSPLSYFGGLTMTRHPLADSPAIDAAGTTDPGGNEQRGFARFTDGDGDGTAQLDIGAVEAGTGGNPVGGPFLRVTTQADEDDGSASFSLGTGTSLREAVKYAPEGSVITFEQVAGFEYNPVVLTLGEIPITKNLFIDASNFSDPVTVSGNNASRIFSIASNAEVAMQHLAITGGSSPSGSNGGGIVSYARSLSLIDCTLTGNRASAGIIAEGGGGGGVYVFLGKLDIHSSTISGNHTGTGDDGFEGGNGGGIYVRFGELNLTSSTVSGNRTGDGGDGENGGYGGGIYIRDGRISLTSSTISGNDTGDGTFSGYGGGIYMRDGDISLDSSTISINQAGFGGGVYASNSRFRLTSSTISGNQSDHTGGGIRIIGSGTMFTTHNSIVAQNQIDAGSGPDIGSSSASASATGLNLISNLGDSDLADDANVDEVDPELGPLSDYGGPTFTMLPNPISSPALNAATGLTNHVDQRGQPMNGSPDIGAVEVQADLVGFTDTDSDGMDDRLEPLYGFIVGDLDGDFDADGDGDSNAEEFENMTGPRDPKSRFEIISVVKSGNQATVTFTTFPGKNYVVDVGPDLNLNADTIGFITPAPGFTRSATYTLPANAPKYFFRAERP